MNLFELSVKISADTSQAEKGMKSTQGISETLANEIKFMSAQFDEAQKNVYKLSPEFNESVSKAGATDKATQELAKKLSDAEKAAMKLAKELDELQNEAEQSENAANGFEESLDSAGNSAVELGDFLEGIKSGLGPLGPVVDKVAGKFSTGFLKAAGAVGAVATAIVAVGKKAIEVADSTRDYRLEMGKLEAAFSASGHSAEVATDTYRTLYSVIGETDQAVEAAQQISLLANSAEEAAQWADIAAGVIGRFGDALQPETFFEAANETYSLNEATGAYVQMLEGCEMSVDDFNAGLRECTTAAEKQAYILGATKEALGEAGEAYKEANADIIATTESQDRLNAAMAKIGDAAEPYAAKWKNIKAFFVELIAAAIDTRNVYIKLSDEAASKTYETADEALAALNKVQGYYDELAKSPSVLTKYGPEILSYLESIRGKYESLANAENGAAEAGYAAEETADSMKQSAEESAAAAAELLETWQDTYQSFYDNLYNAADVLTTVNEKTKITAEEAHGNLEKNTQFYSEMGSNLEYVRDAAEASGVNIGDMLQTLSEMSTSDAAGTIDAIRQDLESLDGNAEAQTAKLQEWADSFKDYSESVSGVATFFADATTGIQVVTDTISQTSETIQGVGQAVTNAQSEVSQTVELNNAAIIENMSSFLDEWEQTIEDLDKSAEARSAAESTLKAMISGLDEQLPSLLSKLKSIGQQMTSTLQSGIGTVKMTVDFETNGTIPGHATGLDYVPYDNYLAYLHRGEAVLTASEAAAWRTGKESVSGSGTDSGGNTTVNQYISAVPQTPVEFAAITEAYFEQARWN